MEYAKIVENYRETDKYRDVIYGRDYYLAENTEIMKREKKVYAGEYGIIQNPFMANHKLPSGYMKTLTDQKVQYLLGNGVVFENDESLDDYFQDTFDETALDLGTEASKSAVAWLYAYKDNNKLQFTMIPTIQLTPVYDDRGLLAEMIRVFEENGQAIMIVYNKEGYKKFAKEKNKYIEVEAKGHYQDKRVYQGRLIEEVNQNFTQVPFIPLYNNTERVTDLKRIKALIDIYDITSSDYANNIDDMQDAFFTLKGFSGEITELQKFMAQLKATKAAGVPQDGEIGVNQLAVPVEAREAFLNRVDKDIFKFGMGVDTSNLSGGSITNEVIKSMFANLDLKCDQFESEFRKFMRRLVGFINANDGKSLVGDFSLSRTMIVNVKDMTESLTKLVGVLSKETLLNLLPFDIDTVAELERLADERQQFPITLE
jgi:SPP1 family phage portal protein